MAQYVDIMLAITPATRILFMVLGERFCRYFAANVQYLPKHGLLVNQRVQSGA